MEPPADVADVSDIGRDPDAFEAFHLQHLPWYVIDSAARYDASATTAAAWLAGTPGTSSPTTSDAGCASRGRTAGCPDGRSSTSSPPSSRVPAR